MRLCATAPSAILLAVFLAVNSPADEPEAARLAGGDRVVLLGGTFVERMQIYGYLETAITAADPQRSIVFRNLGWSGDDAAGGARALFGGPEDGFRRLLDDTRAAEPTVIVVAYGGNEAHAGKAGLPRFREQMDRLLNELAATRARFVLVCPPRYENHGPPLPDPAPYNESLSAYRDALGEMAGQRGAAFIDLFDLTASGDKPLEEDERLTENGVHLTGYGYWRAALRLAPALGAKLPRWQIEISADAEKTDAAGTTLSEVTPTARGLRWIARDDALPFPSPPKYAPQSAASHAPARLLRVPGLAGGRYDLLIDGKKVLSTDDRALAAGVPITRGPQFALAESLRRTIGEKNELFFHRYRPQNETYLFLFRKHEQGENAVEIPQFDPLVEERERSIAELQRPRPHEYRLEITKAE